MSVRAVTIAAIATPPGRGGIGVLRLSGDNAPDIARQLLRSQRQQLIPRQAVLCDFLDAEERAIDQGILIYYPQPASYTGEHVIELQGHGGTAVMNLLLQRVIELGAELARPGEFTERAFRNNKIDLLQAEAIIDLIDSSSGQAARSAMRSLQGKFSDSINQLQQKLTTIRVQVESQIDFAEEDIGNIENIQLQQQIKACLTYIDQIKARAEQGFRLNAGLQAIIIGEPNVGKSSLFNQLTGKLAAIVSTTPGTTRDILYQDILIEDIQLRIIDSAGLRVAESDIEKQGVTRAHEAIEQSDMILSVSTMDQKPLDIDAKGKPMLIIKNKIDQSEQQQQLLAKNAQGNSIYLSAKTGAGIDDLRQALKKHIANNNNNEDSLMARTRHLEALNRVQYHLAQVDAQQKNLECLAEELRSAQTALGYIMGEQLPDDLLGEIFATFCIGK